MPSVKYKLYAFVYDTGDSTHKWTELLCPDGTSRLAKLSSIQYSVDDPARPYSMNADIGEIEVVDYDNYWGNLATANLGLINDNDTAWKDWHFRPIRIDILNESDTVLARVVTCIDDILPSESSPFAKLKTISLGRRAAEAKADAEQIYNGTNIYGSFGAVTDPTLYANRVKSNATGEIKRTWFKHRKGTELLRKTCSALKDDIIEDYLGAALEPDIDEWAIPTNDSRKIVTWHSAPFDYLSGDSVTATLFVNYGGKDYLYIAVKDDALTLSKLYRLDINANAYSAALRTTDAGYYIRKLWWNEKVDKVYMIESENQDPVASSSYYGVNAKLSQLTLSTDAIVTKTLEGFYGTTKKVYGYEPDLSNGNREAGVWIFCPDRGTDGNGSIIFVQYDATAYQGWSSGKDWTGSTTVGEGEKWQPLFEGDPNLYYFECWTSGNVEAGEPDTASGDHKENEPTEVLPAYFKTRMRHLWCERNCFDVGGTSWETDLIGTRKPLLDAAMTTPNIRTERCLALAGAYNPDTTDCFVFLSVAETAAGEAVFSVDFSDWVVYPLYQADGSKGIGVLDGYAYFCYSNRLQVWDILAGTRAAISETHGMAEQFLVNGTRMYYVEEGRGELWSSTNTAARQENWLFDPGGGVSGPPLNMFDMGIDYHVQGLMAMDSHSTDFQIFGVSSDIENAVFSYSKYDYGYVDFCDWENMSIADIRTAVAKMLGGRWFYDANGRFNFKKITDSLASVKDFVEGECMALEMTSSGRDKIYNRYSYIPTVVDRVTQPIAVTDVSVDLWGYCIDVRKSSLVDADYKIVFQTGGSTYKLYIYDTDHWDEVTTIPSTATKDIIVVTSGLIISPLAFGGSVYTSGDELYFSTRAAEYGYRELTYLDRAEVADTASISKYMLRENTLSEKKFIKRARATDTLKNILNDTKDPHPTLRAVVPWEANSATIKLATAVTFVSAKLGLTASHKYKVNSIRLAQGTETILAELTCINIDES